MALPAAFYEPAGDSTYKPTKATMSPWDDALQHGGPPSALAVHALEHLHPRPDLRIARVAVEFLGAIPRHELTAHVAIVRPGRRVELSRTTLSAHGRAVVEASVWRMVARGDVPVPTAIVERERTHPIPALPCEQPQLTFEGLSGWGYGEAIEWRFASGGFRASGPAAVWTRLRIPLVAGYEPSGVERIATVADSANGISAEFDLRAFTFIPTSITLTLDRTPRGDWMFLDASTHVGDEGLGFTSCTLGDDRGVAGIASQTLLLAPRDAAPSQGGDGPSA